MEYLVEPMALTSLDPDCDFTCYNYCPQQCGYRTCTVKCANCVRLGCCAEGGRSPQNYIPPVI